MKLYIAMLIALITFSAYSVGPQDLYKSARDGNLVNVKYDLDYLTKVSNDKDVQHYKNNALAAAASHVGWRLTDERKAVITYLIQQGADVNSNVEELAPALHRAVETLSADLLTYLLSLPGINVNIEKNKQNALSLAINSALDFDKHIFFDMARMLLSKGASAQILNAKGNAPIHEALSKVGVVSLAKPIADFLINSSDSVNIQNAQGKTPLHQAIANYQYDIIDSLLAHKANTALQDKLGNTPLHTALTARLHAGIVENHKRMIDKLLQHNPPLNIQDNMGRTPLHVAVLSGNSELVENLVKSGADRSIKDKDNKTPLDVALAILSEISADRDPRQLHTDQNYRVIKDIVYSLEPTQTPKEA